MKLLALKVKVAAKGQKPNFKGHEFLKIKKWELSSENLHTCSLIYKEPSPKEKSLTLIPAARGKKRAAFVKMRVSREWLARKFVWVANYLA